MGMPGSMYAAGEVHSCDSGLLRRLLRQQASEISPRLADVAWRILHDGLQAGWAKSKGKNPTAAHAPDFKV